MDYLDIKQGDTVVLRDKREIVVTDIADQDPDAYRWYAEDEVTINAEMPVETILIGKAGTQTVVTDMSEVVSIKA